MKFNKWTLGLAVAAIVACAPAAHADIYSYKTVQFTNATSGFLSTNGQIILSANQGIAVNSDPVPLGAKRGAGLWHFLQCSGASTQGVTNGFDVATVYNGVTNWTTTHPIQLISTANGATLVVNWTNVPSPSLDNVALIRWSTCTNGPTQSTNYMYYSYSAYAP